MNRSRDLEASLEGVHGSINVFDSEGARLQCQCQIAQISAARWGAATEVELAIFVHGVCPLSMGIGREDRSRDLEGVHGAINAFDFQ